jgi:predicted Zn-dependent protease with MMP-like domain
MQLRMVPLHQRVGLLPCPRHVNLTGNALTVEMDQFHGRFAADPVWHEIAHHFGMSELQVR